MRVDWKVRGLGILLVVAAVPVLVVVNEPLGGMLAFALAVTGLFLAVVVAERAVPAEGAEALLRGSNPPLEAVRSGLKLEGRPVYVPDQGNVGEERLFLPASVNDRPVPILDADTTMYAGAGETKLGLAIPPPGLELVKRHAAATETDLEGAGVPDLEAFLAGLGRTHDLARGLAIRQDESGAGFEVRFAAAAVEPPCFLDPADPRCVGTGCALCQAAGCTLVRGLGRSLELADADVRPPWVHLRFRPPGGD